jgi:hypothetical protein
VENGGNATQAMREAGYSEATINNPSNLTQSKGFKEIMSDLGLNDALIVSSLVEDIKNKPQNRTKELSLAIELLGMKQKANKETGEHITISPIFYVDPTIAKKYQISQENIMETSRQWI